MKSTKAAADYQDEPKGREHYCAVCTMFRAPDSCTSVEGKISPHGWCRFFEAKVRAAVAKAMS